MTYQEYIKIAIEKLEETTVDTLKEVATEVNSDLTIDSAVLDAVLAALEIKMSGTEFVEFCNTL